MTAPEIFVKTADNVLMVWTRIVASAHQIIRVNIVKLILMSAWRDRLFAKMELLARTQTAATHAFALTDGLVPIVVRISTIVLMRLVSMELPVSMLLVVSFAVVFRAKQVFCVTWMMLVHQILAILMLFVTQAQSMDHIHVLVHLDIKESTVRKILTNVIKDHLANIMVFVWILPVRLLATAHKDLLDHDVKQISTNVKAIHAKMTVAVLMIQELFDVYACQVNEETLQID